MPTRWDQLDAVEQKRMQVKRLRHFLKTQVIPFHPYYRELFLREKFDPDSIRTLADLERIPFTDKSLVAPTAEDPARPRQFVLQPTLELIDNLPLKSKLGLLWKKLTRGKAYLKRELGLEYRPVQMFFTTGRTALPTSFLLTRYDLELLEEVGRRLGEVTGLDPATDRLVSAFPYAPHLAFWQVQAVSVATGCFTLQTGGGKVMGTDGILRSIDKMKPSFLCGIPGYVYHLLREAVESGIDLSSVRTVFLGGDRMVAGFREKLTEILAQGGSTAPNIVSVLGFTEARKCWAECWQGGQDAGLHTYPDMEIFECVDPDSGKILPDGETGELTYTCLDGRGSIVLRYRTGDILNGGITRERCPGCGRIVPRLSSDLSRVSNIKDFNLTKIKGVLVNLTVLSDILTSHKHVDEWQLVLKKRNDDPFDIDEMILALALVGGVNEEAALEEINKALFDALELRPAQVDVLSRAELLDRLGMETQLKEKRIVDLREQAVAVDETTTSPARKV